MNTVWMLALIVGAGVIVMSSAQCQEKQRDVIYLTDMSKCRPASALSSSAAAGKWQLIPYETLDASPGHGTMIGAASFVNAPDVKLPLGRTGWHAVYVGYWNPHWAYDGGTTVKVKLTGDPAFLRFTEGEPGLEWDVTNVKEVFVKCADLTGQDLQFGKVCGAFSHKAYIAYVKLVPLDDDEVKALQADRARTDTRVIESCIDGITYFWANQYSKREHILELVERYRDSDVRKVIWAMCYGDETNYPTKAGVYWAGQRQVAITGVPGNNEYIAGEKTAFESLRRLRDAGIIPQAVAAEHAHRLGLKFDGMFRLAINGAVPPSRWCGAGTFVEQHPEFRQVMADGTPVEKASYAFPQVRDTMLGIIRESIETFDLDGINLCFVRGPQFMQYEQPVLDDFRKLFNADGRGVGFDDPRMQQVRCRYLTEFVRDARRVIDEVGKRKGRRLTLSVFVYPSLPWNKSNGSDVQEWLDRGWLDSVIIHGSPADAEMIAAIKQAGADPIFFPFARQGKSWADEAAEARTLGVGAFAMWDIDCAQDHPGAWQMLGRLGHGSEAPLPFTTLTETHRLKTVGGKDVLQGLGAAVYSGG